MISTTWFSESNSLLKITKNADSLPRNLKHAHLLLSSIKDSNVVYKAFKGFIDTSTNKRYDGLTGQLHDVIHPSKIPFPTGAGKYGGGASRGNKVDFELQSLINDNKTPISGKFSEYTMKVLKYLYENNLKPFSSQVCVCDKQLNIATTLDMLCTDLNATGTFNIINIQLKTGFDENYDKKAGYMQSPCTNNSELKRMSDSYKGRHTIQNLAEHVIVQQNFGSLLKCSAVLVVSNNPTATFHELEQDMGLVNGLYNELLNRNNISKTSLKVLQIRREQARCAIKAACMKRANKK